MVSDLSADYCQQSDQLLRGGVDGCIAVYLHDVDDDDHHGDADETILKALYKIAVRSEKPRKAGACPPASFVRPMFR